MATTCSESDYQGTALTSFYLLLSHKAARNITWGAFQWMTGIYGKDSPLIEDEIYDHEWVDAGGDAFKNVLAKMALGLSPRSMTGIHLLLPRYPTANP